MTNRIIADLFAEDRAHEELLKPLLERLGRDHDKEVVVRVRSARGGHGRALAELRFYQKSVLLGISGMTLPELLVVAIDANCGTFNDTKASIQNSLEDPFKDRTIHACPDPHIERWYLADLEAFHGVVGITPKVSKLKCKREVYKNLLSRAVVDAGHPPTLGGIEFARELVEALDYFRAGKADNSLKHFLDEATTRLKALSR